MFRDRKLKKYANRKLSDYADSEKSLALLKAEQSAGAPAEPQPEQRASRRRMYFGKAMLTLSAVVVIAVTAVLFAKFGPMGGGMSGKEMLSDESPIVNKSGNATYHNAVEDGAESVASEESSVESVNKDTTYLFLSASDAIVTKMEEGDGYSYRFLVTKGEIEISGMIAFEREAESVPDGGEETTVAGQKFTYEITDGVLSGAIITEEEIVYVTACEGGTTEELLAALREVFSKKV